MTCLDRYRSQLLAATNRNLKIISNSVDESAIHQFRVGVKRLGALYRFLGYVDTEIKPKLLLRPALQLSRSISRVRDVHITLDLLTELEDLPQGEVDALQLALRAKIELEYRAFRNLAASLGSMQLRLPTLQALALSEATILRHKPAILQQLRERITTPGKPLDVREWHRKRILLKRYHHSLDAFRDCRGHGADEKEILQMKMLEQLLGDWHDRVVAADILQSFDDLQKESAPAVTLLGIQERMLLGSARIYLSRFAHGKPGC